MSGINQEIVTSYDTLGMSIDEIATDTGFDVITIKAALMQGSSKYRADSKVEDALQFTEQEAVEAKKIVLRLANFSEDENLQFRAARYVLDCKTDRINAGKQIAQVNFNVISFNQQMEKALKAAERTKQKAIDVQSRELVLATNE